MILVRIGKLFAFAFVVMLILLFDKFHIWMVALRYACDDGFEAMMWVENKVDKIHIWTVFPLFGEKLENKIILLGTDDFFLDKAMI